MLKHLSSLVLVALFVVVSVFSSNASAGYIDIAGLVGLGDTVINGTDNAGTNDSAPYAPEGAVRDEDLLINNTVLSGSPLSLASLAANNNYWNNTTTNPSGLILDLGKVYRLDALQLYGYNITDGAGAYASRSVASLSIWTATDNNAVTTGGGSLLVNNIALFTQQGAGQTMGSVTNSATLGDSYLFGGATQPSDVGGALHNVTGSTVLARYLFLRNMVNSGGNAIGLGELRVYGEELPPAPEPSSILLLSFGALGLVRYARRRNGRA